MKSEILEQLREQTRPAHLELENQALLKRLLSPEQTRAEYGQFGLLSGVGLGRISPTLAGTMLPVS